MNSRMPGYQSDPDALVAAENASVRNAEYTANRPAMEYPAMMVSAGSPISARIPGSMVLVRSER